MTRKYIPEATLTNLFLLSGRRCAVCFAINHNYSSQAGQVAHLNKDHSQTNVEDLIWLCLLHHDQYDSKTSQSKNLTRHELVEYRRLLYAEVERRRAATQHNDVAKGEITETLNVFLRYIPYASIPIYMGDFPEGFSWDVLDIAQKWELFKNSNIHLVPFADIELNRKLDKFFKIQQEVEWLVGSTLDGGLVFKPKGDFGGSDRKLWISRSLSRENFDLIYDESLKLKRRHLAAFRELTEFLRSRYPGVDLSGRRAEGV